MKKKLSSSVPLLVFYYIVATIVSCRHPMVEQISANKTIIWLQLSAKMAHPKPENYILKDHMELEYLPVKSIDDDAKWQTVFARVPNGNVKWIFYIDEPVKVNYGFGSLPLVNPGDSIFIEYNGETYKYKGKGSNKLACWNSMRTVMNDQKTPTFSNNVIESLNDYLQWSKYVDVKLSMQMPMLDSYKARISTFEYEYLKAMVINSAESDRIQTFKALQVKSRKDSLLGVRPSDLSAIWDSTINNPHSQWLQTCEGYYGNTHTISDFNMLEVWRKFDFERNNDSLNSQELKNYLYYMHAKKKYKGLLRERLLAEIIKVQTAKMSNHPITQLMLRDYYSQPGFPEYKKQVKDLEQKVSEKLAKK